MQQSINEHIKQLDVSAGGGIISEEIRVDTIDHPMLVIGLGGTGIDAMLRLKYQISKRFRLPEDPLTKKKRQKPDNIEFLAFETNEFDKTKKYNQVGLDPNNELLLLSNADVGSILSNKSVLPEYITNWLSPELNITDGTKGASGNRQAGRLLLFQKINTVVDSIDNKISVLRRGREKKLYVFLLSGLSGGTGSGTFLDIAYIVRGLIEKTFGSAGIDKVDIFGYLFMPDVNLSNSSLSVHTKEYIQKNGFAALKELDYWMNTEEREERYTQKYAERLNVNSPLAPFTLCHLISGTNIDGKFLDNAYDYCMNVTAENIANFMAQEEKTSGQEFAIQDYQSNISANINQMKKHYAANYKYNILGSSAAVLPNEEITTYLAFRVFKKMENMFSQVPSRQEVEEFARRSEIDLASIEEKFEQNVPSMPRGYEQSDFYNFDNVIKFQRVDIDKLLNETYLLKAREEYVKCAKELPFTLFTEAKNRLQEIFLNAQFGPIYSSRLINAENSFSLLTLLNVYKDQIQNVLADLPMQIEQERINSENKFYEAKKSLFLSTEKKKNVYIESKIEEYLLRARKERLEQMLEFYDKLAIPFIQENDKIYNVFTEILNRINDLLKKNSEIIVEGEEKYDKVTNTKTYYWNIINIPDVIKEIDALMDEKNSEVLTNDFAKMLLEKSNKWIFESEVDIIGCISEFLYDKFSTLVSKTMEEFLALKYGKDKPIYEVIQNVIAPHLYNDAKPVFHLSNSEALFNFPDYGIISVPDNVPEIYRGIRYYQDSSLSAFRFNIKKSKVRNRIFWLNTKNGIPLFAYAPIKVYEDSYEKTILEKEGVGRHLVQTAKENWVNLPSPIPEKSWGDTYTNQRVQALNKRIREIFEKALERKCIVALDIDNNLSDRYEVVMSDDFNVNEFIKSSDINLGAENINLPNLQGAISRLQDIMASGFPIKRRKSIFNSSDEETAKENFIRQPKIVEIVKQELRKYDSVEEKLAELIKIKQTFAGERENLDNFLKIIYTDTIIKKNNLYIYNKEIEEDPWAPFVNLLEESNYPEYRIYENYKQLTQAKKDKLIKKANKKSLEYQSDDQNTVLKTKIAQLMEVYERRKEKIDDDKVNHLNGDKLYAFYKDMYLKLIQLSDMLKG